MHTLLRASIACLLAAGCAAPATVDADAYAHMLTVDADGDMVAAQVTGEVSVRGTDSAERDNHVSEIVDAFAASGKRHIVLVIHGGMIPNDAAIEHAQASLTAMEGESFFPIFVNWETGMTQSYADHLFAIRDGQKSRLEAILTSPLYVVSDFGRAIMRYPETLRVQGGDVLTDLVASREPAGAPEGWKKTVRLDRTDDGVTAGDRLELLGVGLIPGAARLVTTPILDGVGRSAYVNMRRRARVLFLRDEDYSSTGPRRQTGALSLLMNRLRRYNNDYRDEDVKSIERALILARAELEINRTRHAHSASDSVDSCPHCASKTIILRNIATESARLRDSGALRVTVLAHSMGAIVSNQLIRSNADFFYDDIVFMGAACTVKEFANSTLPYVKSHPATRFYNLCLHPVEEANDRYAGGAVPFGSLLDWIDNYMLEPTSELDATLGKWENVTRVLTAVDYLTSDVRARIFVKGFGRHGAVPKDHGDFNDVAMRYWTPEFRELPPE